MSSTFVFIGGGNMASAMISGAVRAGTLKPGDVTVAEIDETRREALRALGVHVVIDARPALESHDNAVLVFAVKPQSFADAVANLGPALRSRPRLILSVMAGVRSTALLAFAHPEARLIRIMPNLPAQIGEGATAVAPCRGANETDIACAEALARALGPSVVRMNEEKIDAFTAVAGSGPAYLFYLAESMISAAIAMGFESHEARRIVSQTLSGSALLLKSAEIDPSVLRKAVTSKGGTTQAATDHLDAHHVMSVFTAAIQAAEKRGRELGS